MHAAAGGVGLILCQWAKHLGATVIGTVGSKDKAELAKKNGCDHTILYRNEDFVAKVKEITGGKLCDVVYDGIGKTTFPASLDCLRPLGYFVSFGSASGQIDAFNINILQPKGSLFATRPTLNHYAAKREDLLVDRGRPVRQGRLRRGEDPDQPEISAQGRAQGARGSGRPRDDGLVDFDSVMKASLRRRSGTLAVMARLNAGHARLCGNYCMTDPQPWGGFATGARLAACLLASQTVALAALVWWYGMPIARLPAIGGDGDRRQSIVSWCRHRSRCVLLALFAQRTGIRARTIWAGRLPRRADVIVGIVAVIALDRPRRLRQLARRTKVW